MIQISFNVILTKRKNSNLSVLMKYSWNMDKCPKLIKHQYTARTNYIITEMWKWDYNIKQDLKRFTVQNDNLYALLYLGQFLQQHIDHETQIEIMCKYMTYS